ncbi:unnamed protein product [Adineta ricciae]|uniref:Uncharacterized protein n=1 Tax=Adineta ricciae TaxID=249248 RepID=A0A813PCY7_ADIRI|nr:unnamed protein product [Adineta ricciae]CAF0908101.1 unnamed protein product [Adineta ricciae]
MSIDKQTILHDLYLKDSIYSSAYSSPLMFSRDSSMETLSSFNVNFHSHNSTYTSEHSTNPSGILSPSDIPDSPPRGCDDDIGNDQQQTFLQPLNSTRSTGITVIERSEECTYDDNDVDSIRNYATSPLRVCYDGDGDDDDDDDNNSIHSSLSSLTLPPPPSSSSSSNFNDLRNLKHNLSVINEESLHEQKERQCSSINMSHTTTTTTDDDDDDDDEDQNGKRLLFELIRQRLPHHHISLTSTSDSSSKVHDDDYQNDTKIASSSMNDQTMREDSSSHGLSSHDITIPSSAMQESGYDSLLPMGSAPKRSLSNASLSTTRSITIKKKHRCDEENDDPMNGNSNTDMTDDDDEHYDKKAGEALLRNLIAQVLPSFNPRYLNNDDEEEEDTRSNPRRPSPTSQTYSSSNASSVRSVEIEINKKSEKNLCIRSNKKPITDILQQEKIHSKRSCINKPVHQTKTSELRRLQSHARR